MRPLFTTILSLVSLIGWAQSPFVNEEFINSVYLQLDSSLIKDYLLSNERNQIQFGLIEQAQIKKELNGVVPDSKLMELFHDASTDTLLENWNCALMHNAKCISNDSAKKSFNRNVLLFGNSKWSQRKKARQEKQQLKNELQRINKIPGIYHFSRVIFDTSSEYALFNYRYFCGSTCGRSCTLIFKKILGKWIKIGQVNCKIS